MSELPDELGAAEDWLVAECRRLAGSVFRSIESGPGEWSEEYLTRVLRDAPSIRVVWEGGPAQQTPADILTLQTQWTVYVVVGWRGGRREAQRRGRGAQIGAYRACTLLAPILHHSFIPDVGLIHGTGIVNLWSRETDRHGVAVYGIGLQIPIAITPDPLVLEGRFDDFLTAGIAWDLPGAGAAEDAADIVQFPRAQSAPGDGPRAFSRGFSQGFA